MGYGLIGTGRSISKSAESGLSHAANLEHSRNMMQEQLDQAKRAQKKSTIGTAAGLGAQYGMTAKGGAMIADAIGTGGNLYSAGLAGAGKSAAAVAAGTAAAEAAAIVGATPATFGGMAVGGAEAAIAAEMATATATGISGAGGAVAGAEAGAMAGPWGALIGAGIGLLLGELF